MALTETMSDGLAALTKECTARVTPLGGGLPAGAAFYVDRDLLVTNRHVVGDAEQVTVSPFKSAPRTGTVLPFPEGVDLDIALVKVEIPEGETRRQAVLLHADLADGPHRLFGYPTENFYENDPPGLESPPAYAGTREDNATGKPMLLRLRDVNIRKGFSGGAVLDLRSGAVVAVAVYSENPDTNAGGAAIPVGLAMDHYPELRRLVTNPPDATRRWRELLGQAQWESLGHVWDRARQLDVYLSGDRSKWKIGLSPSEAGSELTIRDLGDEVSEVIVRWAQSSGRRDRSEVALLGRLLSAALFPDPIARSLPDPAAADADPVLIRLNLDASGPLSDLPWEFVTHPGAAEPRFLAAQPGYAFARVDADAADGADVAQPNGPSPSAAAGKPSVLGVLVQPAALGSLVPTLVDRKGTPKVWPKVDELEQTLRVAIGEAFTFDQPLKNPRLSELDDVTTASRHDVVHYVGFGCWSEQQAMIALCRPDDDDLRFYAAEEVLESIGRCRPRLLVLEFSKLPLNLEDDPIGPAVLATARRLGLEAIVSSRAVYPSQYEAFNKVFYRLLGQGEAVEHAVQKARYSLWRDATVDFADFGWFTTLLFGRTKEPRFHARRGDGGGAPSVGGRPASERGSGEARGGSDAYAGT